MQTMNTLRVIRKDNSTLEPHSNLEKLSWLSCMKKAIHVSEESLYQHTQPRFCSHTWHGHLHRSQDNVSYCWHREYSWDLLFRAPEQLVWGALDTPVFSWCLSNGKTPLLSTGGMMGLWTRVWPSIQDPQGNSILVIGGFTFDFLCLCLLNSLRI